jgi:hypothetical protein
MFKSTITRENALAIMHNADSTKAENTLASFIVNIDGKTEAEAVAVAEAMNKKALAEAVTTLWDGDNFKWEKLIDGVKYYTIDTEADTEAEAVKEKAVLVRDIFCKKKTKNSTKAVVDPMIYAMVTTIGNNFGVAFAEDHKEVVSMLRVYTKFSNAPKCFFEDTCASNNSLERQLQVIADTMYGKTEAVKIKKMYVVHAKDTFVKTTKDGYKMGNEIALLQILVDHIADCKNGKKYTLVSKLDGHKEVKEKTDKK